MTQLQSAHSLLFVRPTSSSCPQPPPQFRDRQSYTSTAIPSTSGRTVTCSAAAAVSNNTTLKAATSSRGIKDNSTELIGDTPMVAGSTILRPDSSLALLCTALPICDVHPLGISEQGQRQMFRPDSMQAGADGALHQVNMLHRLFIAMLPTVSTISHATKFEACAV